MPTSTIMSNCSNNAIIEAFDRVVSNHIPNRRWLGIKNYYRKDIINRIDRKRATDLKKNQIEEYIASSIIVHSFDGWSYISRSVDSLINGDVPSSIHMAYYAELRAAMALLGYQGLGVFNKTHVWFDSSKNVSVTSFGTFSTHKAVDAGMTEWAKLTNKKDIIFNILRVKNHTLSDWIRETGFSSNSFYSATVVNHWLKKWSIDLHLLDDQKLRNEMSYRPHFSHAKIDFQDLLKKIASIWEIFEPTESNRFPILDQHMLRIALEEIYRKSKGKKPSGEDYELFMKRVFDRIGEDTDQNLFKFLLRQVNPGNPIILEEAKKEAESTSNNVNPLPIICRALLLLRLSSGAASQMIENSTLTPEKLLFWWEPIALDHGFISQIPSSITPVDLYADIRESIVEMSSSNFSYNNLLDTSKNLPDPMFCYKQFERTGIWGLGI